MKRVLIVALAGIFLALLTGGEACSQDSNTLKFSGIHYYGHTPKIFKLDQDQMIIQFETLGIRVNDNGEAGLFNNASVHIVGVMYRGKAGSKLRAFETWTDKDGDKLIWELVENPPTGSPPGTSPGTAKVFSGTGKYAGMQGKMDWAVQSPKSFPEGTSRGICREVVILIPASK